MVRRRALLRLLGSLRLFEVADIQVVLKLGGCHNMQSLLRVVERMGRLHDVAGRQTTMGEASGRRRNKAN